MLSRMFFFFTNVTYSTWTYHSTSHVPYVIIVTGVRFGYMQHWRFWGVMFFPFSSLSARLSFVHPGKESLMRTLVGRVQKSGIMRVREGDPNKIMDQAPAQNPQSGENYGEDQFFLCDNAWDNIYWLFGWGVISDRWWTDDPFSGMGLNMFHIRV